MTLVWQYTTFVVVAVLLTAATLRHLRSLGFSRMRKRSLAGLLVLIVLPGLALMQSAAEAERERLTSTLEGFAPIYAEEFEQYGHASIRLDTAPDDPAYLALIETQLRWLRSNERIADIYTFRRLDDGTVVLLVDSETDYDRNGRFEGDREVRTAIGEEYDPSSVSAELLQAFDGGAVFQSEISTDRWGTWVAAFHPLRDSSGRVEGVLGVDYPAAEWTGAIAKACLARMSMVLAALGAILASAIALAELSSRLIAAQRQEHQLRNSVAVARASDQAKSDFLANMSHEMRTPLNGVLGALDLLDDAQLAAPQRDLVVAMRASASCLLELVHNTLDLTKIEAGKLELEVRPYSLAALVRQVAQVAGSAAAGRNVKIVVDIAQDIPDRLRGDPTRVRQILLNLIGNAVKFTPQGEVRVVVRTVAGTTPVGLLEVAVEDTGIGIAPDKLETIFHKFTQADSSTTRVHGGSGLGLTIARQLAQLMQGTIDVTSQPGVGSRFCLRLPLVPDESQAPSPIGPDQSALQPKPLARVLLVEDNRVNRTVLGAMLQRLGSVVTHAENGAVAVELAKGECFDLIMMDCQMPVMDGYEATAQIRQLPGAAGRTRIVAITASALAGDRERCLNAGMNDYLTKPVVREELVRMLRAGDREPQLTSAAGPRP